MIPAHLADLPLIWLVIAVVIALDVGIVLVWRHIAPDREREEPAVRAFRERNQYDPNRRTH